MTCIMILHLSNDLDFTWCLFGGHSKPCRRRLMPPHGSIMRRGHGMSEVCKMMQHSVIRILIRLECYYFTLPSAVKGCDP